MSATEQHKKNHIEPGRNQNDEIDLKELISAIWSGKLTVMISILLAAVISVSYALYLPNVYRAEALLSPVSSDGNGGAGSLANKFGGLASLAGVSLSSGSSVDKTTLGIQVLQSRHFFAEFSEVNNVILPLMAAKGWNSDDNSLLIDDKIYNAQTDTWVRQPVGSRKAKPSVQEAHEEFVKILSVIQDKDTGFIRVSVEHFSPYVAKEWVDSLVEAINKTVREQDVAKAERSISYLKQQIATTQLAELQTGLFELIQSQTETIMLANASPEYLFQTIDPAVVPELKVKPMRALICIIGVFIGGILGVLSVLVKYFVQKSNTAK